MEQYTCVIHYAKRYQILVYRLSFIIEQVCMAVQKKYRYQPTVLLLLVFVLMQVFCPAGLLALQARGQAPHSGCHGSMPQAPDAPLSPHRCCMGGTTFKATPSARYVAPALQVAVGQRTHQSLPTAGIRPTVSPHVGLQDPQGLSVLRV